MPDWRFQQRALEIARQIETLRHAYPIQWLKMISEWRSSDTDAAWLTYSANYLLSTSGVKWALDPYSLFTRLGEMPPHNFANDLTCLQVIILSHAHADHLDLNIVSTLAGMPLTWVIPEFMREKIHSVARLPENLVITPKAGVPIKLGSLRITPFEARHFNGSHGVPEMGYLAEFSGKRWLFPGDTRNYSLAGLPPFTDIDGVFAHLWLGRGCALDASPPLLNDFCQYFINLKPKRMVVTHLQELGRGPLDYWTVEHCHQVFSILNNAAPNCEIHFALTGQMLYL